MKLADKQAQLMEDLSIFPDSYERFSYVVDLGARRPPLDEALKRDEFIVPGCTSQLWLVPSFREGFCHFASQADSPMVQGLAGLYCDYYSGAPPEEIISHPPTFLDELGLSAHLSQTRRQGMNIVWNTIRQFAENSK